MQVAANGADVVLRWKASVSGSIVRLGDVVEFAKAGDGVDAKFAAELAAAPLMPTPAPGTEHFLTAAQLRDLLTAIGVDVNGLQFRGAEAVAISAAPLDQAEVKEPGNPPRTRLRPDREAAAREIASLIVRYLREQTGHAIWNVTVSPDDNLVEVYWRYGPQVAVTGGVAPWTGRQRFNLDGPGLDRRVLAFAAVERIEMVAFASHAIAAGDLVRATDVGLKPYSGAMPAQAVKSLEEAVGKEATQAIREGAMLTGNLLRAPFLVRRGERVSVRARAAGVSVRTYATAQQDGSLGDLIAVQALERKDRYFARVTGTRELEVFAGGSTAVEVAGASR
jgi:flagella basal body P-ring formation protein FlgA